MKSLEEDILRQKQHDDSADSIERNTFLLKTLFGGARKNSPLKDQIFSAKRNGCSLCIFPLVLKKPTKTRSTFTSLNLSQGGVTTDHQEIRTHALAFHEDLYCAELCDGAATEQILCDLPHLSEEDQQTLDNPYILC